MKAIYNNYSRQFALCLTAILALLTNPCFAQPKNPGIDYRLIVVLDGVALDGWQEAAEKSISKEDFERFSQKLVSLKRGVPHSLKVLLRLPGGKTRDVTLSPAVKIAGSLESLRFSGGELSVNFEVRGPILMTMSVIYAPEGNDKPFGLNIFHLKITE